ncbi:MAG: STAS domain-containing protein [Planctomycetia bacterium]|nr:STAS domain-containing protein [Planctomycetia bacterium]
MNIIHQKDGQIVTLLLDGKLTNDSVEPFEQMISEASNDVEQLILDCKNLTFISSAGFRIIIAAHHRFAGRMILKHLSSNVYHAFDMTGLTSVLKIQ